MIGWFWAGLATGLAANECCEISDWTARRLVRWSAHVRYGDSDRAEIRAQELEAVIADRPGQLLKLITAMCFVFSAARAWASHIAAQAQVSQVSGWGAATLQLTATATALILGIASLTQLALDRPLQARNVAAAQQLLQSARAAQAQVVLFEAQVARAKTASAAAAEALKCEMFGLTCEGASGRVGFGPLAAAKRQKFMYAVTTLVSLQNKLLRARTLEKSLMVRYESDI